MEAPELLLHAAAWTAVDAAEDDPQGAAAVNVGGTANAAALGAPLVYYSSDYVFDGRKGEPYVESDGPNPLSSYGRSKLHGEAAAGERAWIVRSSWLFGPTGHNFVRTMLRLGAERDEVAVVADQRGSPTYVVHLAEATKRIVELPFGVYHVAADGDCTWADFADAIFEEAGLDCRVRRITAEEFGAPAPRPAYSVLRSEKRETPHLPHWREGLRETLARRSGTDMSSARHWTRLRRTRPQTHPRRGSGIRKRLRLELPRPNRPCPVPGTGHGQAGPGRSA
jgi:dTDP-4-dehydrorhamnose reductase